MITISVDGIPAPQGSKNGRVGRNGRVVMWESSAKVAPWRDAVAAATRLVMLAAGLEPLDCPVTATVVFFLPRPASAPKRVTVPAKYPDTEKLVRSTWDAITAGGGWTDDARVVELHASKRFATLANPPGALIRFAPWQDPDTAYNPFAAHLANRLEDVS
jgi:Holliday junction resolvase RusA-like endonuclease